MTLIVMPKEVSLGFRGGPQFATSVVPLSGGREARNSVRTRPVFQYQWDFANNSIAKLQTLEAFFIAQRGMANAFLMFDWLDNELVDAPIGVGDGATTTFDLIKIYDNGNGSALGRPILYIDEDSLIVKVSGAATPATFAQGSGVVTLAASNAPAVSAIVTASCTFYVPVRFQTDTFSASVDGPSTNRYGSISGLTATEIIP